MALWVLHDVLLVIGAAYLGWRLRRELRETRRCTRCHRFRGRKPHACPPPKQGARP